MQNSKWTASSETVSRWQITSAYDPSTFLEALFKQYNLQTMGSFSQ